MLPKHLQIHESEINRLKNDGMSSEKVVELLLSSGCSLTDSMFLISHGFSLDRSEAKRIVLNARAVSKVRDKIKNLHSDIEREV